MARSYSPFRQTKPVRRAPPKLARAAVEVFAELTRKTRYAEPGLTENWPSIAGAETAALGRPGRISRGNTARTLEIIAPSGAAASALQMRADELLQAVNRYLGPGAVTRIAIRQHGASAPTAARKAPESGPLGAALSSFRAAVGARNSDNQDQ